LTLVVILREIKKAAPIPIKVVTTSREKETCRVLVLVVSASAMNSAALEYAKFLSARIFSVI